MREHAGSGIVDYASLAPWATTIGRVFADAVTEAPSQVSVIDGDARVSLRDLSLAAAEVRSALTRAGVGRGEVVSMQLANSWRTIAAMHGVWSLGAVVNPITTIYRGSELGAIFRSAKPRAVIVSSTARGADFVAQAGEALAAAAISAPVLDLDAVLAGPGEASGGLLDHRDPADGPVAVEPDDVALLMFTSGTTGSPKGVLHSHRTLLYEAASIGEVFGLAGDTVFMPSPLAHVTGLLYGVLTPLLTHGSVSLLDRWDADTAIERIERDGCAFTVSATPFLRGLADGYARRGTPSSLRAFVCGGADIPPVLVAEAERVMGTRVARTYGSTEMPTLCVVRPADDSPERYTSEGLAIGEADARLSDDGELEVRGPELFVGYLDPQDDRAAFTDDGWFRTGDLAQIAADGRITITGRRKDLIVRGGENISAKEVEDLLALVDGIAEVAVIGLPDPVMGERACAVVILRPGAELHLADLTAHLDRQSIARQKYPELLWAVDAFPRTVSGKVQKFLLRQQAVAAAESGRVEARR